MSIKSSFGLPKVSPRLTGNFRSVLKKPYKSIYETTRKIRDAPPTTPPPFKNPITNPSLGCKLGGTMEPWEIFPGMKLLVQFHAVQKVQKREKVPPLQT